MPVIAAAVCPHPPVLLPEVAVAASGELDVARAACDAAVARLLAAEPDTLVVVGGDTRTGRYPPGARGSFRPYGVATEVRLAHDSPDPLDSPAPPDPLDSPAPPAPHPGELPLSLAVGAWLLGRAGTDRPRHGYGVAATESPQGSARLGAALHDAGPERLALLVMGDGSACRGVKSPGYDDPRAVPYDDGVATALADADADALLRLDPALSARLRVAGRAPWQVLAGAVGAAGGAGGAGGAWRGRLDYYAAPYGVAYFVASWTPGSAGPTGVPS